MVATHRDLRRNCRVIKRGSASSGDIFLAICAIDDYPADIRNAAPAPTTAQKRSGLISGIIFIVVIFLSLTSVVWLWAADNPDASFVELALMAGALSVMFALFDLVIIDWLVICTWSPQQLMLPGTEECAGWKDYGFHVKEQLQPKALFVLFAASLVMGFVVWWLA
ncbi:hypothetical protein [Corynebacterium sp. J010B-136]|uniref:hypothetical protein n=1 Tax=Corynebacterium sp. J010B-136 TaxID=2099401 RepID=UPI000CF89BF3|nr:hypothetical protein [Corynebacterium sp. J010B-136]